MLPITSNARRRGVSSELSALRPAPPASVRSGNRCSPAVRNDCSALMPCAASRDRSVSLNTTAARVPGRSSSSSSGPVCHGERCSSIRASTPATAPQFANDS